MTGSFDEMGFAFVCLAQSVVFKCDALGCNVNGMEWYRMGGDIALSDRLYISLYLLSNLFWVSPCTSLQLRITIFSYQPSVLRKGHTIHVTWHLERHVTVFLRLRLRSEKIQQPLSSPHAAHPSSTHPILPQKQQKQQKRAERGKTGKRKGKCPSHHRPARSTALCSANTPAATSCRPRARVQTQTQARRHHCTTTSASFSGAGRRRRQQKPEPQPQRRKASPEKKKKRKAKSNTREGCSASRKRSRWRSTRGRSARICRCWRRITPGCRWMRRRECG